MDDDVQEASPRPEWRNEGHGRWTITLPSGHSGVVGVTTDERWQAVVSQDGKAKISRPFKNFKKCIGWAERELYPRPTAWDRIKAV